MFKKIQDSHAKSKILKRKIGILYLIIAALIYVLVSEGLFALVLSRLFICFSFAFFGLSMRAIVYYGLYKKNEDKELRGERIKECLASYLHYGIALIVFSSVVYGSTYMLSKSMETILFNFLSGVIFIFCGFFVGDVVLPRLRPKK